MEIVIGYNENNRVNFMHKHATLFFLLYEKERKDKKNMEKKRRDFEIEVDILPSDVPESEEYKKYATDSYARREAAALKVMKEVVPKYQIHRKQREVIDKMQPLWKFEQAFLQEQKARRNSPATIKHYLQTFNVFNDFLARWYSEDDELIMERAPEGSKNPYADSGCGLPILMLENEELQRDFGDYLVEYREVSEQTVLTYFRDFRAFMYYAMDCGYVDKRDIKIKNTEPPIKEVYTEKEINLLLRAPSTEDYVENRDWVVVNYLLGTGNRAQTILNLKVKDIDIEEGYVNINIQKNRRTSRQGLPTRLVEVLEDFIRDYRSDEDGEPLWDKPLFATKYGEKMSRQGLYQSIANYNRSRGVYKTSIHLFRHTFAKMWILDGGDVLSLQKALGQSNLKMAQRYANLYAQDVKEKIEKHSALSQQRVTSGKTIRKKRN
jgi:integrase/recombinase XerD